MAVVKELFANRILQIQGIGGFILIQGDGQILASKTDMSTRPQTLAAMMILSGQDCNTLRKTMGLSQYHYLMISREKGEKLYVFPVQGHFLGVIHRCPDHNPSFVKKIKQFIQDVFPATGNGPAALPGYRQKPCHN
ncbi:MAG: roadblock/LC7 domain-containing protein [Pseudomonadota bacterium]